MDQGFTPRDVLRRGHPHRGGAARVKGAPEDLAIGVTQTASTASNYIFMGTFFGPMIGGFLGNITSRWPRVSTAIKSVIIAPFTALQKTNLKDMQHYFVNYRREVADIAENAADVARKANRDPGKVVEWVDKLRTAAKDAEKGAIAFGEEAAIKVKPIGKAITDTLDRAPAPVNQFVKDRLNGRAVATAKSYERVVGKIEEGFTREIRGFGWRIRAPKATNGIAEALQPAHQALQKIKNIPTSGAAAHVATSALPGRELGIFAEHLQHLPKDATTITRGDALKGLAGAVGKAGGQLAEQVAKDKELLGKTASTLQKKAVENAATNAKHVGARADVIGKLLQKAANKINASIFYRDAAKDGLSGLAKLTAKGVGGTSMFTGIVVAGALAGAAAVLLNNKKESRQGRLALKELTADLGDTNHPIVQEARKAFKKQGGGRNVSSGLMAAAEVGNGVLMATPGMGGALGMAGIMGMQMGGMGASIFVPDNAVLDAYAQLKAHEKGQAKLEPAQRVYFMKSLVALVPAVAANGGQHNKLAEPIASAIVERNLSVRDSLRFIADHQQFMALARQVNDQVQAKEAEAAKAETKQPEKPATAAYQAADKPGNAKVQLTAGAAHERLAQTKKSLNT